MIEDNLRQKSGRFSVHASWSLSPVGRSRIMRQAGLPRIYPFFYHVPCPSPLSLGSLCSCWRWPVRSRPKLECPLCLRVSDSYLPSRQRNSRTCFPTPNTGPLSCQDHQICGLNTQSPNLFTVLPPVLWRTLIKVTKNKARHNADHGCPS